MKIIDLLKFTKYLKIKMPEIKKCRICDNKTFSEILNLGNQYYSGRFPLKDRKFQKQSLI